MAPLPVSRAARRRLKLCGAAALMLLVAACGDGIPKDDDDGTPPPPPAPAISIFAGDATATGTADGAGAAARFNHPQGLAIDRSGNLYVADRLNGTIRRITPEGVVTTFAGSAADQSFADGNLSRARFERPVALALNAAGTLFVADGLRIRAITAAGQVSTVTTLPVGSFVDARSFGDVIAGGIAVDNNDNLFITNSYGTRRVSVNNTFLLEGQNVVDNLFGTRILQPRGILVDGSNNVYLFDLQRKISRWNAQGNSGPESMFTLAGAPDVRGAANGTGSAARFEQVVALASDPQGNLYAADAINNLIRKITPAGVVTTLAGTTRATELRVGGLPGSLADVRGVVSDGKGNLFVTSGQAVVKIRLP